MIIVARPGSDEYEEALRGLPRAERINDVIAKPGTKSHDDYAALLRDRARGEPVQDPNDEYRYSDERWQMIGRALRLYRDRDETTVKGGVIYLDEGIACAPHGVDGDLIAVQVHVRTALRTFERFASRDPDNDQWRVSQAQMAVSRLPYALQLEYCEEPDGTQHLVAREVKYDPVRAGQLLDALREFALNSRHRVAA